MNLKNLSDDILVRDLKQAVSQEREIIVKVLWHLAEVEKRMLYAARGYSSLFAYCVSELKYSESAAMRRITSMRLLKSLPEPELKKVEQKITDGDLNLSHLNQLHQHCRTNKTESTEEKLDLIEKVSNTSTRECERTLAAISTEPIQPREKNRAISADHSQVTLVVPNTLLQKIERVRNTRAHKLKSNSLLELIELLVDEEIERDEKKKTPKPSKRVGSHSTAVVQNTTSVVDVETDSVTVRAAATADATDADHRNPITESKSRYIKRANYRAVYKDAGDRCQYLDYKTKKRCDSKFKLQIEHCKPFALGGSNHLTNLKLLCATHNALRSKEVFGRKLHVTEKIYG